MLLPTEERSPSFDRNGRRPASERFQRLPEARFEIGPDIEERGQRECALGEVRIYWSTR